VETVQRLKWTHFEEAVSLPAGCLAINHEVGSGSWGTDLYAHNLVYCFAYAFSTAAWGKRRLSWLDYGGGLGHYRLFAEALFPQVRQRYACLEVPALAQVGRELNPKGRFFSDKRKALRGRKYDFILAGVSLCFTDDWKGTFQELSGSLDGCLYVTEMFVAKAPTFVVRQRPRQGYQTEYCLWIFNRGEFLQAARASGLRLVREMYLGLGPYIHGAPEQPDSRGFLFKKAR
jgi:putative methyltransferase (TIGR04325 family)